MLCQSLPKHVLDNISTFSSSSDDIWDYSNEKYGNPEVVAREVVGELMSLDSRRLGSKFMGKFCTMVQDTHTLLSSIDEQDWLISNRAVSELEGKLPREEKLEWAKIYCTVESVTKF